MTFSNVVLTNLSSDKQELTKQEPTVLSDLNDESQVNLWAGETGYQYFTVEQKMLLRNFPMMQMAETED